MPGKHLDGMSANVARPHVAHLVETYHPMQAGVYRYEEARQMQDESFHLMVLGFREP